VTAVPASLMRCLTPHCIVKVVNNTNVRKRTVVKILKTPDTVGKLRTFRDIKSHGIRLSQR
jgi:hypothetical protein